MATPLKARYVISLSRWKLQPDEDVNRRWSWTGWTRRYWPANLIRPGTLVYAFDRRGRQPRLIYLLRITHGAGFYYRSKREFRRRVEQLTGKSPSANDPHWH